MMILIQMLLLATVAHAQRDLPYPLQLVRLAPSGVPPSLYEKNQHHDSLVPGAPPREDELPGSSEEMSQFHSQDASGRSLFGYMLPDQMRIEARRPDGTVRGSYIYRDASGQAFKVQYWDEGAGFHAAGSHLPGMFRDLPQPVQDTPEVEAARKQHLAAYQQVLQRQLQLLYQQQQEQQQQQQVSQVVSQPDSEGDGEGVVVESDPAAPPQDFGEEDPGQRYPALPLVPALYDPSHVHDVGRDAVIVDSIGTRQSLQGEHYRPGGNAYQLQPARRTGHLGGVTNVGGFPPVAMQYLQGINFQQDASKESVVLDNLIGRSAKGRSLELSTDSRVPAGKVADVNNPMAATKEELVSEPVAAGSSNDEQSRGINTGNVEYTSKDSVTSGAIPPPRQSVVSVKDGPAESYSAMFMQNGRQAKGAGDLSYSMPQPHMEGGFFYSFHHPVIPVAVQLEQPAANDSPGRVATADISSPPRGLSVSQRASLYDAVPVAAVHDAQVPPYLRGAVSDHQTKPIFIHYDPAEVAAAS